MTHITRLGDEDPGSDIVTGGGITNPARKTWGTPVLLRYDTTVEVAAISAKRRRLSVRKTSRYLVPAPASTTGVHSIVLSQASTTSRAFTKTRGSFAMDSFSARGFMRQIPKRLLGRASMFPTSASCKFRHRFLLRRRRARRQARPQPHRRLACRRHHHLSRPVTGAATTTPTLTRARRSPVPTRRKTTSIVPGWPAWAGTSCNP